MNQTEWLTSGDPTAMLAWLTDSQRSSGTGVRTSPPIPGERKLRLFACECYAGVFPPGHDVTPVVEAVRRWADGEITREEAIATPAGTDAYDPSVREGWYLFRPIGHCLEMVMQLRPRRPHTRADWAALLREVVGNPWRPVWLERAEVACPDCPDGGPYDDNCDDCGGTGRADGGPCPWLTPQVLSLASAAYDERLPAGTLDPFRLALVADALEEAGCDSEPLLRHLRGEQAVLKEIGGAMGRVVREPLYRLVGWRALPGPHVRGCWCVDTILGKS